MRHKIEYRKLKVYKYELLAPCTVILKGKLPEFSSDYMFNDRFTKDTSALVVMDNYQWDGASGCAIDTDNFMRGSLVHDALYQAMREGLIDIKWRKYADKVLRDICRSDGMGIIRSSVVYRAVRLFGESSATPPK